jgi:hypothetical protein
LLPATQRRRRACVRARPIQSRHACTHDSPTPLYGPLVLPACGAAPPTCRCACTAPTGQRGPPSWRRERCCPWGAPTCTSPPTYRRKHRCDCKYCISGNQYRAINECCRMRRCSPSLHFLTTRLRCRLKMRAKYLRDGTHHKPRSRVAAQPHKCLACRRVSCHLVRFTGSTWGGSGCKLLCSSPANSVHGDTRQRRQRRRQRRQLCRRCWWRSPRWRQHCG